MPTGNYTEELLNELINKAMAYRTKLDCKLDEIETDQTAKADNGKPKLTLVPPQIMFEIESVRSYGNKKYHDPNNWRNVSIERYWEATLRHIFAAWNNVRAVDPESGLKHISHASGCNAFDSKRPTSNPMAFWTEQDVLLYIKENNIPIASVYGDVVVDYAADGQLGGQMRFSDLGGDWGLFDNERPTLKTTGCNRTGCMFCGFGCHLEKPGEGRFETMKKTHPKQYEYIMKPWDKGGLGYKDVIDWINENGNVHISY